MIVTAFEALMPVVTHFDGGPNEKFLHIFTSSQETIYGYRYMLPKWRLILDISDESGMLNV